MCEILFAALSQVMDSETESNNATLNDCSIGSLSTLEADDQHLMISGKLPRRGMTPSRRLCFISSIVFLLGVVAMFLLVLPCPDDSMCRVDRSNKMNWIKDYENTELKGPVNVVDTTDKGASLIFMYRRDRFENRKNNSEANGVISIMAQTGKIAWYAPMNTEPKYVNCSVIDLDRDGVNDCVVVDIFGQLSALKSHNGVRMWSTQEYKGRKMARELFDYFSFPLILPDLDNDKVNELLHIFRTDDKNQNSFSLLSGRTGKLIGHSISDPECIFIHELELVEIDKLKYTCINATSSYTKSSGFKELHQALTKTNLDFSKLNSSSLIQQNVRRPTNHAYVEITLQNLTLTVTNKGECPMSCNATISLIQTTESKNETIYNFTGTNIFALTPLTLTFQRFQHKHGRYGFVFKYLQWSANPEPEMPASGKNKTDILHIRLIKETVGLIMFNSATDLKIENTSQSHIMQFCRISGRDRQESCQPKINDIDSSMLVADLDKDGSQELVTFYSTFAPYDEKRHVLKTYVQLLDLEMEIPKLYGAERRKK